MNLAVYIILVLVGGLLVVIWLKERALYVVFFAAFTQNFVLAYSYTNGLVGKDACRSLILLKEFLLLGLFVYSVVLLYDHFNGHWPRPLVILLLFSGYCVLRFAVGAVFFGDFSADGLRKLRMMCYPLQILTVAVTLTWKYPEFCKRFVRHMIYSLAALALVGIVLFVLPDANFWKQHVDIAAYNIDVKGDDPSSVLEDQGIPGTGAGREAFLFLSSFRAMGTFADPLAFGFAMAMPILLLTFHYPRDWTTALMLVVSSVALFVTFSRSAWIFVVLSCICLWFKRGKYILLGTLTAIVIVALVAWPPLAEFAASDYSYLSWTDPAEGHAKGLVWFYQKAFTDTGNIFGKGMSDAVQNIPESGYAFLLEHFGFFAYASFIWFCVSLFRYLGTPTLARSQLQLVGQAVPLCVLIVMHTSQYPFAFSEYLFIWFVVGNCFQFRPQVLSRSPEIPKQAV